MPAFVDRIAVYLKESKVPLQDWTIILPSERAKQYVQRALFEAYGHPVLAPKMQTIYQWVQELTPETVLDKARLLLLLFEIHRRNAKSQVDFSFDEYMAWGNILLSDFDELDRYLIDSRQLFRNLKDIKEIENWSFGNENLSDSQKRFMEFWDRLPGYYAEFNALLRDKKAVYMGKAYRQVAENIQVAFREKPESHFLFAGFNALSPAEMSIFKQLDQLGRGNILMDADAYYLKDKNNEAGTFMRSMLDYLGKKELPFVGNSLLKKPKRVEVISCAQSTGQARVVGSILERMDAEKLKNTLVLLADETLIVPLLKNIPQRVGKANITLGLPLRNSSLRTWVELIFRIQEGIEKYNKVTAYHKDLIQAWNHPFVIAILNERELQAVHQREKEMRRWNTVFQSPGAINSPEILKTLIDFLYTPWKNNWAVALQCIRGLNHYMHARFSEVDEFEKALIQGFDHAIIDFENCIGEGIPDMSLRTFKVLFNQQWTADSIAYYGNPIEGLQIMGLLETRLLDFKTIVVLGMNEGKMPPTNPIQTFVPMDLRRYFGLPTPREKQGLFAHHFYRLLHECEEMYITYTTSSETLMSSEPSRYLMQLELELARDNPDFQLINKFYTIDNDESQSKLKSVPKTTEIMDRLDELFAAGTSASAIKAYMACPLDFYYKYVLKFGEEKKVEEEVESNTFGTFIHEVLEELYKPFARRNRAGELVEPKPHSLQVEDIDRMLKQYEFLLRKVFSEHFKGNPEAFETGKNYLSFSMAMELTERFLKFEKKKLLEAGNRPVFIETLEEEFAHVLELEIHGKVRAVRLKGFADRVDSWDGKIRIVDYKTGKVELADVGAKQERFDGTPVKALLDLSKKSKHFFQLMVYNYLYFQKYGIVPEQSAIISFVKLYDSPFSIQPGKLSMEEVVEHFPEVFRQLLEEIYDPETPFVHTDAYFNYCTYCV